MKFILQSPKTKLTSTPVDEADVARLQVLQARGWKIVKRIGEVAPEVKPSEQEVPQGLPDDVPSRDLLLAAGIETLEALTEALPSIHTVKGIGPQRAAAIRQHLNPESTEV